jgi:gp32 DNA binding protein like
LALKKWHIKLNIKENIMATLAEIRAKLQQSAQQTGGSTGGDNAIYPHWNIAEGTNVTVRFLPDGNPNNTFFWIERAMIKLPFAGVKGETNSKPVTVQVPCMEMWGETCPILTEVRPWFKDKSLEDMGRKYWKKKSYLFQGFVVDSKLQEDKTPENPIRRFIIGSQIFNIVKNALMDSEIEELPTDYVRGLDFKITKTSKGGYADYSTSNWARRERALSAEETAAIEQYGLFDLSEFLPKKPGEVELKVIKEMFEASVDGEAFDMDRWGQYFKPAGMGGSGQATGSSAPVAKAAAKPVVQEDEEDEDSAPVASAPAQSAPAATGDAGNRAADIIAMIRKRQQQ